MGDLLNKFENFIENVDIENEYKTKKILIIDGSNLFIRCFIAYPTLDPNGSHIGGVYGFFNDLKHLYELFNPDQVYIAFDGVGGSQKRKSILEAYKGQRTPYKKYNRFEGLDIEEQEEESKFRQMGYLIKALTYLPVKVFTIPYIEADDTISYLLYDCELPEESLKIVCSSDKDFLQMVDDDVYVYSPLKKKIYDKDALREEYGCTPYNYLILKCFEGDRSDNIKGVKMVGKSGLSKNFNLLGEDDLDIEQIIKESEEKFQEGNKSALYRNIVSQKETLRLNFKLMQLYDVDISAYAKKTIRETYKKSFPPYNFRSIFSFFTEIGHFTNPEDYYFWENLFSRKSQIQ